MNPRLSAAHSSETLALHPFTGHTALVGLNSSLVTEGQTPRDEGSDLA